MRRPVTPSKSSTQVRLPIPRTDTPSRASEGAQQPALVSTHFTLHFVLGLSCALWETNLNSSCCAARLHFPSAALYFIHESVEPNSFCLGEGWSLASPQERGRVHTQLKCDASQGGKVDGWMDGWMDGWRRELDSHLRSLEGRW